MSVNTLEDMVRKAVEEYFAGQITAEVRKQISLYNVESLARHVNWVMGMNNEAHKKPTDPIKTLENFQDLNLAG